MQIRTLTVYPDDFPAAWASHWGEDEYGIYMGFTYRTVPYTFRWIEPGTFLMGSPEDEPDRVSNETQHEVTLTQGFWLGETTVTQAVWESFMGNNPSNFKGADRPVDNVSWDDAQAFISKVNGLKEELNLCLPTEAQWEYACRAGTTTPFSFGENITPEQVNYDGNHPYHNGKKGQYREETVPARSLPPNPWGLYEMHGNVWEWCNDWYGEYPKKIATDPSGSAAGELRVLRGGSWILSGRNCRSAIRSRYVPGLRDFSIGFRLARGLELPASPV